jgi:hypothetical protein
MPRIPTRLLRKACAIDPLLPALLAPCRDLGAAQGELRWLREHVERVAQAHRARGDELAKGALLRQLVRERASGKPLQYVLGTEYFGDLEIRCRPGVLIPRCVGAMSCETSRRDLTAKSTIQARHCGLSHASCPTRTRCAQPASRTTAARPLHWHWLHPPPVPARAILGTPGRPLACACRRCVRRSFGSSTSQPAKRGREQSRHKTGPHTFAEGRRPPRSIRRPSHGGTPTKGRNEPLPPATFLGHSHLESAVYITIGLLEDDHTLRERLRAEAGAGAAAKPTYRRHPDGRCLLLPTPRYRARRRG